MIEAKYSNVSEMINESLWTTFFRLFCVYFFWTTRSFQLLIFIFVLTFWRDRVSNLNMSTESAFAKTHIEWIRCRISFCLFKIYRMLFVLAINFLIAASKFLMSNISDCMKWSDNWSFCIKKFMKLSIQSSREKEFNISTLSNWRTIILSSRHFICKKWLIATVKSNSFEMRDICWLVDLYVIIREDVICKARVQKRICFQQSNIESSIIIDILSFFFSVQTDYFFNFSSRIWTDEWTLNSKHSKDLWVSIEKKAEVDEETKKSRIDISMIEMLKISRLMSLSRLLI